MDIMDYKSYWTETEGTIPDVRINIEPHVWDLGQGDSFSDDFKYKNTICRKVKNLDEVSDEIKDSKFAVKPVGDIYGHMIVEDNTLTPYNDTDDKIPVMPNYVRDLAGRVICIAECYPVQKNASVSKRFPLGSFIVDESIDPDNLIENVFFSFFRTLDMSSRENDYFKNGVETRYYAYASSNLHPYKLRADTFYQDGWKLPQTEMLFVNISTDSTDKLVEEFENKWSSFANKQDYEAFYEECGGEEYFESLFKEGVTLIPTLEAYNANAIVSRSFDLEDYHTGKYVPDFHELDSYVESDLPAGTIVKVLEPGYLTYNAKKKAVVVVSNGAKFISANKEDPDPLYPDLRLPHSRTSSRWGDVFIPTHPKHFEQQAIWGWDTKTGMFMQEKGPIWDPLHYYYASVDHIIYHYQGECHDGNTWLYEVPGFMKRKFYPVIPLDGFDIHDEFEKQDRIDCMARPYTMCKRFTENVFSANIGYHPMPPEFEFEIDSWFYPILSPVRRVTPEAPLNIRDKIASVISCNVSSSVYIEKQEANADNSNNVHWVRDVNLLKNSSGDPLVDYPYLSRYYSSVTNFKSIVSMFHLYVFTSNVDLKMLRTEYSATLELPNGIDNCIRDMTVAYYDLKEGSFLRIRDRVELYEKFHKEYISSSWNSSNSEDLKYMLKEDKVLELEDSKFSSVAIMQPPTF